MEEQTPWIVLLWALVYAVGFFLAFFCCKCIYGKILPNDELRNEDFRFAMKTVSIGHALIVGPPAFRALFFDPSVWECTHAVLSFSRTEISRLAEEIILASNEIVARFTPVCMGYFLYELSLLNKWEPVSVEMTVAHHVLSIILWPLAITLPCGTWHMLVFLASEVSSPFLQLRWMISKVFGKEHIIYIINGVVMLISFLTVRCVPGPAIIFCSIIAVPKAYEINPTLFFIPLSIASVIPTLMNSVWGVQMIKGALKIVMKGGNEKRKKKNDKAK